MVRFAADGSEALPESGPGVTRLEAPTGAGSVRVVQTHERAALSDQDHTKLCTFIAQFVQLPSRLDRLLLLARGGATKPSGDLETHLRVIEKTFQDRFVRNSVHDRKVLRKIALDLEKSVDFTERGLGQLITRYIGGTP